METTQDDDVTVPRDNTCLQQNIGYTEGYMSAEHKTSAIVCMELCTKNIQNG